MQFNVILVPMKFPFRVLAGIVFLQYSSVLMAFDELHSSHGNSGRRRTLVYNSTLWRRRRLLLLQKRHPIRPYICVVLRTVVGFERSKRPGMSLVCMTSALRRPMTSDRYRRVINVYRHTDNRSADLGIVRTQATASLSLFFPDRHRCGAQKVIYPIYRYRYWFTAK